ncbi:MAG: 3-hydroxyacyl-CoA dehydrogenase [Sphingomonadales bacterium BRH_c42]|nr:MAG: 3-hydroxyacyl-CoA dehydrogenase [Sphingomonadales bacterium BRH_c42]
MSHLAGQHVVITGGGTGIGAAIARRLAAEGAKLTLAARDVDRLRSLCATFPDAQAVHLDITDEASVAIAMESATARAPVSILVNNAGGAETAPLAKTSLDLWQRMIALNLTGTFLCSRALLASIISAPNGRIINVASTAGLKGYAYTSAYAAAKHGVIGLTRSLALEIAGTRATANAVCPGFTDTGLLERSLDIVMRKTGMTREEALAAFIKENPQNRLIDPDEVAAAVFWLCDPLSASVNGQSIAIAGGEVM